MNLSGFSYAEINFDAKWNIESGYDYVQLEVSNDNGNSWIPQCGRYTNKGIETHDYALDEPLYDGNQSTWINESITLTDYLGEEILIRFKLYTDGGLRRDGFYFDNFKIKGLSNNLNNDVFQQKFARIFPNPVENYLNIISSKNIESLTIYSILGELVLKISDVNLNNVYLNHLNKGIYLLELTSNGFSENHIILKK